MAHSSKVFSKLLQLVSTHDFKTVEENDFRPERKLIALTRWINLRP